VDRTLSSGYERQRVLRQGRTSYRQQTRDLLLKRRCNLVGHGLNASSYKSLDRIGKLRRDSFA
jgi:hypothetical protein